MAKGGGEKFVEVHRACRSTLDRLSKEADQTLNLLSLVKAFPGDTEKEAALRFQYEQENKAHADYTRCRRELFGLLPDSSAVKAIKTELKAGWLANAKA